MQRLTVRKFGPIREASVDIARFMLFIGPQASGKSTLSKLIYYFLHVRDEIVQFVYDWAAREPTGQKPDHVMKKRLRNLFVEFFGPAPQPSEVEIEFRYTEDCRLKVSLDRAEHKYLDPHLSHAAWQRIRQLLDDARRRLGVKKMRSTLPSAIGKLASEQTRASVLSYVREQCNEIFAFDKELLFIPAGRSMLSTLSDQLQYIHPHLLDYPMREFVDTVNRSRAFFDRSLNEIVRDRKALTTTPIQLDVVRRAQEYVTRVLRGEYICDREGGKLFVAPKVFTKINFASSGQQEAVWILLSLFLIVLQNSRFLVVVEEPEAHLYPDAQKAIIEFIAFVFNAMNCDFIITTHSPYLLSLVNGLLYAQELGAVATRKVKSVVSRELWIDADVLAGYFVDGGTACPMLDRDIPALRWELLDRASDEINDMYTRMLDIEAAHAK